MEPRHAANRHSSSRDSGFLLWPTQQTLPDGTAYRYHVAPETNVLKLFTDAMREAGLGSGFYYSLTNKLGGGRGGSRASRLVVIQPLPPPTHSFYLNTFGHSVKPPSTLLPGQAAVTQAEYEALSLKLMSELWSDFGPLQEVWLDGGCGSMCDAVNALLRTRPNAANAVAFNGGGGTSANAVRWCGTEGGHPSMGPGGAVWSTADCGWCPPGSGPGAPPNATDAAWYPSGVDVTIQMGDHWCVRGAAPFVAC